MFVLELTYTGPLERADALMDAHIAWVDRLFAEGVFIASGRKNPRDGGVILAVGDDRARIEEIVAGDPFTAHGVCVYRITEFTVARTAPELDRFRQQPVG